MKSAVALLTLISFAQTGLKLKTCSFPSRIASNATLTRARPLVRVAAQAEPQSPLWLCRHFHCSSDSPSITPLPKVGFSLLVPWMVSSSLRTATSSAAAEVQGSDSISLSFGLPEEQAHDIWKDRHDCRDDSVGDGAPGECGQF